MKAIAYLRRSAKPRKKKNGEEERTVSLEQQAGAVGAYARAHGLDLVAALQHDGVSGGKGSRFDELWQAIRQHEAGAIVAYHFDRLGRDLEHLLAFRKRCDKARIEIHVVGQGKLPPVKSSQGFLETSLHGMIAEHYRLLVGEKTKDALAQLRANGQRWWGGNAQAPYGWRLGPDGRTVEPDPAEQEALRAIRLAQDGTSLRHLAQTLAGQGLLARNGRPFAPSTLHTLLQRG